MFHPIGLAQNAETAKDVATILNGAQDITMERKYDGFRLLGHVDQDGRVRTYTRTGTDKGGYCPLIEDELAKLPPNTWVDGEIVALDDKGMPAWGTVQSIMGANINPATQETKAACLTYIIFDLLAFDGTDVRPLPLRRRREALETVFEALPLDTDHLTLAEQFEATDAVHDLLVDEGWEGTIVKRLDMPYASGKRGKGWWKLKANDELDCVIMGFKPGENSFTGLVGAIEFGQIKDGVLTYRGRCSGMNMKVRKWMTDHAQFLIDNQQVISLAHMGIMPSGSPRHPQFRRIRNDKPAGDCVWV